MDLMTLDGNQQPAKMIENYDSLIWSERYNTVGDFQITTGDIDRFMTLLPEGTLLAIRESTVPMIVETHLIERKKGKPTKLTIKGRDFCSILDRRVSVRDIPGTTEWVVPLRTPMDVAYFLIDEICVGELLSPADTFPASLVQFIYDAYDTSTSPIVNFTIPRGNLLTSVQQFLQSESKYDGTTVPPTEEVIPHGIRAVRPPVGQTPIQVQIYHGTDRTNQVYFDATRDMLDDGSYLFSSRGFATAAQCISKSNTFEVDATGLAPTGMDRRVILVDASNSNLDDDGVLANAKISLAASSKVAMFDGALNQDISPYVYNVDYGLGDIVKLVGDYGLASSARVTEYIRSEDATGTKSYPTLVTIQE